MSRRIYNWTMALGLLIGSWSLVAGIIRDSIHRHQSGIGRNVLDMRVITAYEQRYLQPEHLSEADRKAYRQHQAWQARVEAPLQPPAPFRIIPSWRPVYRSAQPTADELTALLRTGWVRHVVRLNGDAPLRERGALSQAEEAQLCGNTARFHYYNLDRYPTGSAEWWGQAEEILAMLQRGHVIIHCRNGRHRIGVIAGIFLARAGWTWEEIVAHNQWQDLAEQLPGGDYADYLLVVKDEVENQKHSQPKL